METAKGLKARFWSRSGSEPDVSFLEEVDRAEAARHRPAAPSPSRLTEREEAESHARWNRAKLKEKFRGPVTPGETLALGLGAATLAAFLEHQPPRHGPDASTLSGASSGKDAEAAQREAAAAEGVAEATPAQFAQAESGYLNFNERKPVRGSSGSPPATTQRADGGGEGLGAPAAPASLSALPGRGQDTLTVAMPAAALDSWAGTVVAQDLATAARPQEAAQAAGAHPEVTAGLKMAAPATASQKPAEPTASEARLAARTETPTDPEATIAKVEVAAAAPRDQASAPAQASEVAPIAGSAPAGKAIIGTGHAMDQDGGAAPTRVAEAVPQQAKAPQATVAVVKETGEATPRPVVTEVSAPAGLERGTTPVVPQAATVTAQGLETAGGKAGVALAAITAAPEGKAAEHAATSEQVLQQAPAGNAAMAAEPVAAGLQPVLAGAAQGVEAIGSAKANVGASDKASADGGAAGGTAPAALAPEAGDLAKGIAGPAKHVEALAAQLPQQAGLDALPAGKPADAGDLATLVKPVVLAATAGLEVGGTAPGLGGKGVAGPDHPTKPAETGQAEAHPLPAPAAPPGGKAEAVAPAESPASGKGVAGPDIAGKGPARLTGHDAAHGSGHAEVTPASLLADVTATLDRVSLPATALAPFPAGDAGMILIHVPEMAGGPATPSMQNAGPIPIPGKATPGLDQGASFSGDEALPGSGHAGATQVPLLTGLGEVLDRTSLPMVPLPPLPADDARLILAHMPATPEVAVVKLAAAAEASAPPVQDAALPADADPVLVPGKAAPGLGQPVHLSGDAASLGNGHAEVASAQTLADLTEALDRVNRPAASLPQVAKGGADLVLIPSKESGAANGTLLPMPEVRGAGRHVSDMLDPIGDGPGFELLVPASGAADHVFF